jgi:hypothetical protein
MVTASQQAGQAALPCLRCQSAAAEHAVLWAITAARFVIISAHQSYDAEGFVGEHDSVILSCLAYLEPVSSQG